MSGDALPAPMHLIAPAKINLALEVTGKRPDGYHEVATVMTTITLADRVTLTPREAGTGLRVTLTGIYAAGIDPADDLAGRAATRLAEATGRTPDVEIAIEKRIPSPGGLGGGSSDAGAVLRGLARWWAPGWPADRLAALGATIGSDVPFFIHGGTALCTGRGEVVEPLRDLTAMRMLILVPPVPAKDAKTAARYGALRPHDFTDGWRARRLAQRIARNAPPPTADLINVFEAVIERTDPELVAHYAAYAAAGAPRLHLCGSGPAVFLLIHQAAKVHELQRAFAPTGATIIEARTLGRAAALATTEGPVVRASD